jgi:hypothetical protein
MPSTYAADAYWVSLESAGDKFPGHQVKAVSVLVSFLASRLPDDLWREMAPRQKTRKGQPRYTGF